MLLPLLGLSALWVYVTAGRHGIGYIASRQSRYGYLAGLLNYMDYRLGFEATADAQKSGLEKNQANKGKFIQRPLGDKSSPKLLRRISYVVL